MGQALLVIDMLNDFIDPQGTLWVGEAGERLVPALASRLEQAREREIPVIYVADRHLPSDPEFEMFPPHSVEGTWGAEIVPALAPRSEDRVIPKRRYSAFFGTDLDLSLREAGAQELILTGVCTNICVLYTAADARNLGYRVTVPRDLVASFDQEAHRWALKQMESVLGATVEGEQDGSVDG